MHFLTDITVAALSAYLAFTGLLADQISSLFTLDDSTAPTEEVEEGGELASLPSRISGAIPDILLRSAEYQQAALVGATGLSGGTTNDPINALVNIFCTFTTSEYIRTTTGTGFFIDPDGVIITNAHVAQFLLLEETNELGDATCTVRAGDPATPKYQAELLYLPPAWVQDNANVMHEDKPLGTGERDYALLYISESVDNSPLPALFPALSFNSDLLPVSIKNKAVLAAGYPAGSLYTDGPSAELTPLKASSSISELYTFGSNYADVFSIRGSVVGAEGASGGPVLNDNNEVIGVIVTRGDDTIDGEGSLRAITLSHIDRTIQEETGFSLEQNLGGNLPYRSQVFSDTLLPFLLAILENNPS
jgi:hypothetical protein